MFKLQSLEYRVRDGKLLQVSRRDGGFVGGVGLSREDNMLHLNGCACWYESHVLCSHSQFFQLQHRETEQQGVDTAGRMTQIKTLELCVGLGDVVGPCRTRQTYNSLWQLLSLLGNSSPLHHKCVFI